MNVTLGILLAITGLGMTGFWLMHILKGGLPDGIRSLENGGYLAFHISAELITAAFCIVSGAGLISSTGWSHPLGLISCGMLFYTSLNSMAWGEIRKTPKLSVMFIVPLIISIFGISWLLAG